MALKSYFTPESLEEALALKAQYGRGLWLMAGGTIFMHLINDGHIFPEMVMGIRRAGMDGIALNGQATIGAGATLTQMTQLDAYPMLAQGARSVAGWAVRNMGTVGGNLFARPPYGDFGVALLALNARLKIQSSAGERTVKLADFYNGGRQLAPEELVTEIHVPRPSGRSYFYKQSRRQEMAAPIVTVAVNLVMADERVSAATVALGGAGQTPVRATAAEAILLGAALDTGAIDAAANAAAENSRPVSDPVASEWYRRKMVAVQLKRALTALAEGGN